MVRVQKMLVLLQISDHFPIHSFILQRSVQNDKNFRRDGPIVQIRDVSLKNELKRADRTHLVLMLSVQTLQKIYMQKQKQ